MNMFSNNQNKKIPRNLNECIATDDIVINLWTWAERLEKFGKVLLWIIIAWGLISSISGAYVLEEVHFDWEEPEKIVAAVFVVSVVEWAFYAFLEYCAYHILALLVGSLASIVQHTKITANIAMFEAEYGRPQVTNDATNHSHIKSTAQVKTTQATKAKYWTCDCGTENSANSLFCESCGASR